MSTKEGSLGAPVRHPIDWNNPNFVDDKLLDDELRRVFDICHGCRRCFNLCESFPKLFDYIDDSKSGELDTVSSDKFKDVDGIKYLGNMNMKSIPAPYMKVSINEPSKDQILINNELQ